MATILVDYENVGNANGLHGVDALRNTDILTIFYSGCCRKIRQDYLEEIKKSDCRFRIVKLKETGKNALDFYIAAECGIVCERGEKQLAIISNDKGFQSVIDYFSVNGETKDVQVIKAGNVEMALSLLNASENAERRKELQHRMQKLDLEVEYAKMETDNSYRRKIEDALLGSKYEDRAAEIIDFVKNKENKSRKKLYTGSLHLFGRNDGTEIYRMVKDIEKGSLKIL